MTFKTLFKKEDYWAIWIASGLLLFSFCLFLINKPKNWSQIDVLEEQIEAETVVGFKTTFWYQQIDDQKEINGGKTWIGKALKKYTSKPGKWSVNPISAFYLSEDEAEEIREKSRQKLKKASLEELEAYNNAREKEKIANAALYKNKKLNEEAQYSIGLWRSAKKVVETIEKKSNIKSYNRLPSLLILFVLLLALFGLGKHCIDTPIFKFAPSFALLFVLAVMAYLLGGQKSIKAYGLGYAFWAILIGLVISNTIGVPKWLKPCLLYTSDAADD